MMITSIVLISFSGKESQHNPKDEVVEEEHCSVMIPIGIALFGCLLYTLTGLLARVFVRRGFSSM